MNKKIKILIFFFLISTIKFYGQQSYIDSLQIQLENLSGEEKVDALDNLADRYQLINTKKAIELATRGAELAEAINYKKGLASCYGSLGYFYINSDNSKALEYTQKALSIRQDINDKAGIATSLNVLGVINYYKGDYFASIDYHIKAMKMREEIGNEAKIATSYNNIALVYLALDDFETALNYLNKALEIRIKTNNQISISIIKGNIGDIYSREGKFKQALNELNKALKISEKMGIDKSAAAIYLIIGRVYISMGDNDKAFYNYMMAKTIYTNLNEKNGIAQAENGIATSYLRRGKNRLAVDHALIAMQYSNSINSLAHVAMAANILQTAYKRLGNYKKALEYFTTYKVYSDSLNVSEAGKKVAKTEFAYTVAGIKDEQKHAIENQQTFIRWLTITLLLSFVIVILIVWGYLHIKKVNRQLNDLNKELREINSTKDRFFSIIAHDLRGPFHSLLGLSDVLSKEIESLSKDEIQQYNADIHTSLKKQFELLNNLLHWSRIQNKNYNLTLENINLYDEIQNAIQTLELTAAQKNLHLFNEVDKNIIVSADKNMIELVLRNLIANSIKFSIRNGYVKIISERSDGTIKITVSDNGVGIPNNNLDKIFRVDIQYSTPGTMEEKGTGLGLILCKEIVEKHGGKIWIDSELGKRTDVSFTLKAS